MWNEIRADRTLVETMAGIPPRRPGHSHGTNMQEPENVRSLGTAIRYMTAAGMATQRAQRAFLAHRKAKQAGLILPAAEPEAIPANQNCTNEFPTLSAPAAPPEAMAPESPKCTNELPAPDTLAPLRARLGRPLGRLGSPAHPAEDACRV